MVLIIDIKVVPSSGRSVCKLENSSLKCYLKSAPEKGKANKELVKMLAKKVGVSSSKISIVSGETSRKKRIKIDADISFDHVLEKLGIEKQLEIFK